MHISTRFLAAASIAAMSLFAGSAMADGEKYVIGTDSTYPPFEYVDASGQFLGFDMDIARALCTQMKAAWGKAGSQYSGAVIRCGYRCCTAALRVRPVSSATTRTASVPEAIMCGPARAWPPSPAVTPRHRGRVRTSGR